ncbi:MAG: hypothetical protein COW84_08680 [Gammaproteobacteria bacterium CG22_combo_CG10-13_8_21_14_all_40_8]|nr:MAG: hypothetical protein COW84_08680 [Gammaproteobacteria bacterium CG22_combo_CG10-13_8_21_14_all_40_8]
MHEKTLKGIYVSTAGKFLQDLDNLPNASSKSVKLEQKKYQDLGKKRDEKVEETAPTKIWRGF